MLTEAEAYTKFQEYEDSFGNSVHSLWATYGDWSIVGNGQQTNSKCGKFSSFMGCSRIELHNNTLVGNFKGQVYVRPVFHSCDKPSCPVCYLRGWATREARNIEARLKASAFQRFGNAEHIVASVPMRDYGLEYSELRSRVVRILSERGVIGGALIFHGFRYADLYESRIKRVPFGWYWSPHFHVLGFIKGGYGQCRSCPKINKKSSITCAGCSGFEARTRRCNVKDGYIVKVLDERKTVGGTAWYQLNHASINTKVKRFHVATWFGVCSYRKLKLKVEDKKRVCPICGQELYELLYLGSKKIELNRSSPLFKKEFYSDFMQGDKRVWEKAEKIGSFQGG
jgi:hypothetical protein